MQPIPTFEGFSRSTKRESAIKQIKVPTDKELTSDSAHTTSHLRGKRDAIKKTLGMYGSGDLSSKTARSLIANFEFGDQPLNQVVAAYQKAVLTFLDAEIAAL